MPSPNSRRPSPAHADAVGVIVALLERYPQVATLNSDPVDRSVTFSFAVTGALERSTERELRESIGDHVRALLAIVRDEPDRVTVDIEGDDELSLVRVTRDARTLTRAELGMLTTLLGTYFGDKLVHSAAPETTADLEDDAVSQDEIVDYALDALRDPASQRSLVGFREEMRVMVYFIKGRKKPKARARS